MRASTVIDASIEECAAHELNLMSRGQTQAHFESGGKERSLTKKNDHSAVFHAVYDFKIPGFQPREFVLTQLWSKLGENMIVLASEDMLLPEQFPTNSTYVRASAAVF